MSEQFQILLSKVAVIKLRQEYLLAENSFNIFRILKAGHEEVGLHSRFLFELLNPKGSHGMGDVFLQLFVKECDLPPLSYDTVHVLREHANIDILIQDNNRAIVIENKVYAGDQYEQLKRYFEYTKSSYRQPTLVYLTLNGTPPSEESIGDVSESPVLISYKFHISSWLVDCIKEAVLRPVLRETLVQYQTLINQLTGNTMNEAEKQEVLTLVGQGDNAEQAAIIARNWNHVRWHTEWDFWSELSSLASAKFDGAIASCTDDNLSKIVHGGNNKNYYYGIEFPIGSILGNTIIFKIERGDEPVYYGIHHCSSDELVKERMRGVIQTLGTASNEYWAGYKATNAGIDLHDFDTPITLQLVNPSRRQAIIAALWQEIQAFIASATFGLQKEFGADFLTVTKVTAMPGSN